MSHTLNLTRFAPAGHRSLTAIFALIGPAVRNARAVEAGSKPLDADLRTLGVKRSAFDRILAAKHGLPATE